MDDERKRGAHRRPEIVGVHDSLIGEHQTLEEMGDVCERRAASVSQAGQEAYHPLNGETSSLAADRQKNLGKNPWKFHGGVG